MSKLGKKLIAAAKEGVAIARGEADPKTFKVNVPDRSMSRRCELACV